MQITLSCFKLSGFVILVFSKAKGITLVFRNDPLESLKVSSTFDSIPFIAEYLQKEIERQVRRIFQEDLPVAVHRLSLRLWNPEYAASLDEEATAPSKPLRFEHSSDDEAGDESDDEQFFVNPLLTSADNSDAPSTIFSQKSLLGLSSLVDSQKTLSLDTPTISDAVFRAWASGANQTPTTMWDRPGALDEKSYTFSDPADVVESQSAAGSVRSTLITSPSRHSTPAGAPGRRRKKHRVVDLRNARKEEPLSSPAEPLSEPSSSSADPTPDPSTVAPSECAVEDVFCDRSSAAIHHAREDSIDYDSDSKPTLLPSPLPQSAPLASPPSPPPQQQLQRPASPADSVATADATYPPPPPPPPRVSTPAPAPARAAAAPAPCPAPALAPAPAEKEKEALRAREARRDRQPKIRMPPGVQGSILEQAILSKIMVEIQRSLEEERLKRSNVQTKWGVERELESLCSADELPAYRAN